MVLKTKKKTFLTFTWKRQNFNKKLRFEKKKKMRKNSRSGENEKKVFAKFFQFFPIIFLWGTNFFIHYYKKK